MYTALFHTHRLVVSIFVALYFIKMILLLMNKTERLNIFRKWTKVPEIIVSVLFLVTGVWMIVLKQEITTPQYFKFVAIIAAIPCGVIGFGRGNKILGVLSFVLLVAAYGIAEAGKKFIPKVDLSPTVITDENAEGYDQIRHGSAIYTQYCKTCHGADGQLSAAGAMDLTASNLSRADIIDVTLNGRRTMPPFKSVLSQSEAEAVAAYTESLRAE
jgi:mono/diheme cytochrome c family protein